MWHTLKDLSHGIIKLINCYSYLLKEFEIFMRDPHKDLPHGIAKLVICYIY